jgi:hypothetical protein
MKKAARRKVYVTSGRAAASRSRCRSTAWCGTTGLPSAPWIERNATRRTPAATAASTAGLITRRRRRPRAGAGETAPPRSRRPRPRTRPATCPGRRSRSARGRAVRPPPRRGADRSARAGRVGHERPHGMAGAQQQLDQRPPDVAGCAGDQDARVRCHCPRDGGVEAERSSVGPRSGFATAGRRAATTAASAGATRPQYRRPRCSHRPPGRAGRGRGVNTRIGAHVRRCARATRRPTVSTRHGAVTAARVPGAGQSASKPRPHRATASASRAAAPPCTRCAPPSAGGRSRAASGLPVRPFRDPALGRNADRWPQKRRARQPGPAASLGLPAPTPLPPDSRRRPRRPSAWSAERARRLPGRRVRDVGW